MSRTSIEWTQQTWNPIRGCSPVSPGCKNCYAERQAGRFCGPGKPFHGFVQIGKNGNSGPHWTGKVELIPKMLDIPLRRTEPTTWFVNSMSDLFHESLPSQSIDKVFAIMCQCREHTFQVLTKRPERMRGYMAADLRPDAIEAAGQEFGWCHANTDNWPPSNVWLGVSAEDQERADERILELLQTPAAVRFVSLEPLLGPIDLNFIGRLGETRSVLGCRPCIWKQETATTQSGPHTCSLHEQRLDWVIVGGESGPNARPCDVSWIRSILHQCQEAGVNCFVKQLGSNPVSQLCPGDPMDLVFKDRKGADMDEWPEDLCWREFPMSRREKV